jgi:hypothetical protein
MTGSKLLSIDPATHSGWSLIDVETKAVFESGLIVCKNVVQFDNDIAALIRTYKPIISEVLIEESTFKGYNLKSYATLHDIFFLWKLNILKSGFEPSTITIQELNHFIHGMRRTTKKDWVKKWVSVNYNPTLGMDDNIADSIYNGSLWIDKKDYILRLRQIKLEKKAFVKKIRKAGKNAIN